MKNSLLKASISTLILFGFFGIGLSGEASIIVPTIVDGDLIKTADNPDVYIVKLVNNKKFKRLILNPAIFNSYGHLSWDNIKTVDQALLDNYTLSELVIEVNPDGSVADPKVYKVSSAPGSDVGERRWLNMTSGEFEALGYDWDSIYHINRTEASQSFYPTGTPIVYAEPPATATFTIEADDFGFYVDGSDITSISVDTGKNVEIIYNVSTDKVYYGGLDFRGCGQDSGTALPGESILVKFTASSTCNITSYWPATGYVKDIMTVNVIDITL